MEFQLQQCVSHIDKFDPIKNDNLSIGVEIQDFVDTQLLDGAWLERVRAYQKKLQDFKGIISLHGAFVDLNPASPDSKIVEVTKERYIKNIRVAKFLDASYLVFHSQINPTLKNPVVKEKKLNRQLAFWEELLKEIEKDNITILLENFAENNFEDLLMLVEKINSPKVKVCLDLGHILANTETEIKEWIKGLKSHIPYIHFHWNDRTYDAHQAPNEDYVKEVIKILNDENINPILSLEYRVEDIEEEVSRIRKYIGETNGN